MKRLIRNWSVGHDDEAQCYYVNEFTTDEQGTTRRETIFDQLTEYQASTIHALLASCRDGMEKILGGTMFGNAFVDMGMKTQGKGSNDG